MSQKLLELLTDRQLVWQLILSVALLVAALALRAAALGMLRRTDLPSAHLTLRLNVQVRRAALTVFAVGLVIIWASEIRTMALSITAIAAALVIATKEMLLCVMGSILRSSSGAFTAGDRIEVDGVRGDVVDLGLVATTIHEIGPGHQWTGRAITVPNSVFLSKNVVNETLSHRYVLHIITVPLPRDEDWRALETQLLAMANEICEPYLAEARDALKQQAVEKGLEPPRVEPFVRVELLDDQRLNLLLRLPTLARDKGVVEQRVMRRVLGEEEAVAAVRSREESI
jgi:small-conductance mechanosensitive channel